jgi:hypothetical protein
LQQTDEATIRIKSMSGKERIDGDHIDY